ncbi:MAG: manganese-binding transcriptional regulator MntR [Lautropia sp.]|nr:manganese-binding transcriptional regulator MntR [Lautropia sp.]
MSDSRPVSPPASLHAGVGAAIAAGQGVTDERTETVRAAVGSGSAEADDSLVRTEGFQQVRDAHRVELIEDYVELIAELIARHGRARQVQIAECLGVSQPTVARMLKRLDRDGYLVLRPYQGVQLTDKGQEVAEASRRRHLLVEAFLRAIGVDEITARRDAEGLEHHASQATLDAFSRYLEKVGKLP